MPSFSLEKIWKRKFTLRTEVGEDAGLQLRLQKRIFSSGLTLAKDRRQSSRKSPVKREQNLWTGDGRKALIQSILGDVTNP